MLFLLLEVVINKFLFPIQSQLTEIPKKKQLSHVDFSEAWIDTTLHGKETKGC